MRYLVPLLLLTLSACSGGNVDQAPATPTPSTAPSPTPAPTATPTAAPQPSPSATPTTAPTASPEPSPSATPTASPTPTPTSTPEPTPEPTPDPTPTAAPTPTPEPTPLVYAVDGGTTLGTVDLTTGDFFPVASTTFRMFDVSRSDQDDILYLANAFEVFRFDLSTSPATLTALRNDAGFPSDFGEPNGLDFYDGELIVLSGTRPVFGRVSTVDGSIIESYTLPSQMRGAGDIVVTAPNEFWATLTSGSDVFLTRITLPGPVETVNLLLPDDVAGFNLLADHDTGELVFTGFSGAVYRYNPVTEELRTVVTAQDSGLPHLFGLGGPVLAPTAP